jgi:hypothetical protein
MSEHEDELDPAAAHPDSSDAALVGAPALTGEYQSARERQMLKRRYNLSTLDGVRREMSAIYRKSRDGAIDPKLGSALVWQLSQIVRVLEIVEVEHRIARLEELAASRG